jgi:integrase
MVSLLGISLYTINDSPMMRYESNFLNSIRTDATRQAYKFYFKKYSEFVNGNILGKDTRKIEIQIIDFLVSLKKRGLVYSSVKSHFCAIAHFYIMNDIVLNRKKIIKFIDTEEKRKSNNTGYNTEQIIQLVSGSDLRIKVIILIYASTGIRLGALHALKIRDIKFLAGPKLYQIKVYQGYKEEYITFCTPECAYHLDLYLDYRKRFGEKISPDAPLIREQFNSTDILRTKHPRHIDIKTISKILRNRLIHSGVRTVDHVGIGDKAGSKMRKDIPLVHGFRKFFNTALMNADVHPSFKELLMGHSVKLDDVYYDKNSQKSQDKLLDEYSKAIDNLTIFEENRLREKVEMLTIRADKIQQLEAAVEKLQRESK